MIKAFFEEHGHGFWLHMLGAVAIMAVGWWVGVVHVGEWRIDFRIFALGFNTSLWPVRELSQKGWEIRRTLTFHVFLEWFPAVAVGFIIYWITA